MLMHCFTAWHTCLGLRRKDKALLNFIGMSCVRMLKKGAHRESFFSGSYLRLKALKSYNAISVLRRIA